MIRIMALCLLLGGCASMGIGVPTAYRLPPMTNQADADAALDALDNYYNQPATTRLHYEPSEHLK